MRRPGHLRTLYANDNYKETQFDWNDEDVIWVLKRILIIF